MVEELVRVGMPGTRCLTGPHERAPSLTRKSSAANTVTEKTRISTSPKVPSWRKTTAKGYMKTTSMSKITKIIATR
jgi:hypothetical protein